VVGACEIEHIHVVRPQQLHELRHGGDQVAVVVEEHGEVEAVRLRGWLHRAAEGDEQTDADALADSTERVAVAERTKLVKRPSRCGAHAADRTAASRAARSGVTYRALGRRRRPCVTPRRP
jgi:hypothetical protein